MPTQLQPKMSALKVPAPAAQSLLTKRPRSVAPPQRRPQSPQPNEPRPRAHSKSLSNTAVRPIPTPTAPPAHAPVSRNPETNPPITVQPTPEPAPPWTPGVTGGLVFPRGRKNITGLRCLHHYIRCINHLQLSIVTPPPSVLIIVLGLRLLSQVQFRQRNKPTF
jgi:hypothetical protein